MMSTYSLSDHLFGRPGDLPLSTKLIRHHHSQLGASHVDHRHLLGDVPLGIIVWIISL